MNALLVRVGADLSIGGGSWNGPVDSRSGEFAYVAIPENVTVHLGTEKPYSRLAHALSKFGVSVPSHLAGRTMHLDPDFQHLTYGDDGQRAQQLRANLGPGDTIAFYAGLKDIHPSNRLVYAIIGLYEVESFMLAIAVPEEDRDINAHSRRVLTPVATDTIVRGRAGSSGRLQHCLPIGEFRDRAYRVRRELLDEWGGLSLRNGYLQRSARLPVFLQPERFTGWLDKQSLVLIQANN